MPMHQYQVPRRPARFRPRFVVEGVAVIGGFLTATVAGIVAMPLRLGLLVTGAICVAVPVYLKSRRELAAERAIAEAERLAVEYEARLATTLGDFVMPLAHLLGALTFARGRELPALRGQLQQAVVSAAARLCGPARTRAVFFLLDGDSLRPSSWAGRGDEPTTVFRRGDRRGDLAHALVTRRDFLFVRDVDTDLLPPGVHIPPTSSYKSFLAVAVFADDAEFGMLTVDAPEPGALDESALHIARTLAYLLGAGLAIGRGQAGAR